MTISTSLTAPQRGGVLGRIRHLFEAAERPGTGSEFTSLEDFNDHLLRDIGMRPYPSRHERRLLMRF